MLDSFTQEELNMKLRMIGLMIIALAVMMLGLPGNANAYDWIVDDDGTWADYDNIQDAINGTDPGDTILIYNGTYYLNFTVDKSIELIGNGSADTVIDVYNASSSVYEVVVNVTAGDVSISGLNITGGNYGIIIQWSNGSVISNCMVTNNYVKGIYVNGSDFVNITECNVSHNGDGIFLRNTTWTSVHNSSICKNMRGGGNWNDGIRFDLTVQNVTIWGNLIYGGEYGLDLDDTWGPEDFWNIMVINNNFTNQGGDGLYFDYMNKALIKGNLITGSYYDNVYISNCYQLEFVSNNISDSEESGVESYFNTDVTFSNNTVSRNWEDGIYLNSDSGWNITYNEIFQNTGYGIYVNDATTTSIHHNNFHGNNGGSVQGFNDVTAVLWDDNSSEGNYWSDWNGTGTYSINGTAGAEDMYPLDYTVNTSAPEKIPEFPGVTVMAFVVAMFAVVAVRRRRLI